MEIESILHKQRAFFSSGQTRPLSVRLSRLLKLQSILITNEQAILRALKQDLNKSEFEELSHPTFANCRPELSRDQEIHRWLCRKGDRLQRIYVELILNHVTDVLES